MHTVSNSCVEGTVLVIFIVFYFVMFIGRCGQRVSSLYVDYSEGNVRLTRCEKCGEVADKYVEYELLLVLMDVIMHQRGAIRHLMFNRYSSTVASVR